MYTGSAYEAIKANIGTDGKLPRNFYLDKTPPQNYVRFIPGFTDGMHIFPKGTLSEEFITLLNKELKTKSKKMISLFKKYFKTEKERYMEQLEALLADSRAYLLIDFILQDYCKSHRGIDPKNMTHMILDLIKTSSNIELIKIGISLLGLFDFDISHEAQIAEIISTLALYEDFTLYAAIAALNWKNSNSFIFIIAKNVEGWGRVHAVERLKPESDEIRQWLLRSCCSSSVMGNYMGLTCAVKGDLIGALRQASIDDELFDGITIIIDMLIDEEAVDGISQYEYAQEALVRYLNHAKQHANATHLKSILDLQSWAKNAKVDYAEEILAACAEMIERPDWKEKILSVIKGPATNREFFSACTAADQLNIDVTTELFDVFKAAPLQYSSYIPQLLKNPSIAAPLINLCEAVLPLDEMADGMGQYNFSITLIKEHDCLNAILPELAAYPRQGVKLIKAGLNSRVIDERDMACSTLLRWVKALGMPLTDISPMLYEEILRISKLEVYYKIEKAMGKLLAGETANS